jgi:CheY-like chemotaxis protein
MRKTSVGTRYALSVRRRTSFVSFVVAGAAAVEQQHSNTHVLIADDHVDTRVVLKHYLEAYGFDVCEAVDGADALEIMRHDRPDAVILDVQMPKMDGMEVLRAIRADSNLHDVPVLMLSGDFGCSDSDEAAAAGANDCLSKPAHPRAVFEAVRTLVRVREH